MPRLNHSIQGLLIVEPAHKGVATRSMSTSNNIADMKNLVVSVLQRYNGYVRRKVFWKSPLRTKMQLMFGGAPVLVLPSKFFLCNLATVDCGRHHPLEEIQHRPERKRMRVLLYPVSTATTQTAHSRPSTGSPDSARAQLRGRSLSRSSCW